MIIDKHIHSPYCPHGSKDTFEEYIMFAKKLNYQEISFTEHAPLPKNFTDPTPMKDSAMDWADLPKYLEDVRLLKEKYKEDLIINVGLEIDYIVGFEEETKLFLNEYGPMLDDSILSVHFLYKDSSYYCLDYSEKEFEHIAQIFGSVHNVYDEYFRTVHQSILANLGPYKPKRLGHITLVEKFKKLFPVNVELSHWTNSLLDLIAKEQYILDYNGAGMVKPYCGETYPSLNVAVEAAKRNIPLIYGSDAHSAKGLKQGYDSINTNLLIPYTDRATD